MCLTKLEFPPHGKRCGNLEHMTVTEKAEHLDRYNARRRERYAERKFESEPLLNNYALTDAEQHFCENLHLVASKQNANTCDIQVTKNLFAEKSDDLAHSPIAYSSIQGADRDNLNEVYVLRLENGQKAYFKPFLLDEETVAERMGIRSAQMMNNEIAAYKFSQALGGHYDGLVPETTLREEGGRVGSVQAEVIREYAPEEIESAADFDSDHLKAAALFDYVAGSLDRHTNNFIIDKDKRLNLIDNGLAFPDHVEDEPWQINYTEILELAYFSEEESCRFTKEDVQPFVRLLESEDSLGMHRYLTPRALKGVRSRAKFLVENLAVQDYFFPEIEDYGDEE